MEIKYSSGNEIALSNFQLLFDSKQITLMWKCKNQGLTLGVAVILSLFLLHGVEKIIQPL